MKRMENTTSGGSGKVLVRGEKFKVQLVGVATGPSLTLFCFRLDSGGRREEEEKWKENG